MKSFAAALAMLSWFPLPASFAPEQKHLQRCANWFPVIGIIFGLCYYALSILLFKRFPVILNAAIIVFVSEIFTKGFHLDGLADTFDGFLSGRGKEKILEIMKDSRSGSMGIFAVTSVMIIKFAALASMSQERFMFAALTVPAISRSAMLILIIIGRYARNEGLGKAVFVKKPYIGLLLFICLCAAAYVRLCHEIIYPALAAAAVAVILHIWCIRKIGGETGDTLGACQELASAAALIAYV